MASFVYNDFKGQLFKGEHDLVNHPIRVILLQDTYSASDADKQDNDVTYSDVSAYECPATGNYSTSGEALTSKAVTVDTTDNEAEWDAADVTWASSTITARYAALINPSVSGTNGGALICEIDFGSNKSSSSGDFTIQWNAEGILNLGDA